MQSNNRLAALPESIGKLGNLQDLDCSLNRLSALPALMGQMKRLKRINACHNQLAAGSIPAALLRDTAVDTLRIEGNPISGLEGEDGFEEYAKRAKTHQLKNIDQRVRTGDLSKSKTRAVAHGLSSCKHMRAHHAILSFGFVSVQVRDWGLRNSTQPCATRNLHPPALWVVRASRAWSALGVNARRVCSLFYLLRPVAQLVGHLKGRHSRQMHLPFQPCSVCRCFYIEHDTIFILG